MTTDISNRKQPGRHSSGFKIVLIVLATIVVTVGATFCIAKVYLFPSEFKPVQLSAVEEQVLNDKLERFDSLGTSSGQRNRNRAVSPSQQSDTDAAGVLVPERYSEKGADRTITLSERELNALLAKNTDLARKLAIDLSDNLISAKLLVPLEEDFPILGGKVLKVRAGVELAYRNNKPIVVIKGISIMGVPIPNAWLGGLKNIDLVEEYGADTGFWKSFADGVNNMAISEGQLQIELKE
jgi:hypothetical protein